MDERPDPVPKRVNKLEIYFEFRGFAGGRRRRRRRTAGWVLSRKDLYIAAPVTRGNSVEKCVAHKYRIKKLNSAWRLREEVDFRAWVAVYRTINATGRR